MLIVSKGGIDMDPTILSNMQTAMANFWYLFLLIPLLPAIISGILTAKLAAKKGYYGYFFTGFFFNLIGLIYVVGLPLAKDCAMPVRKRTQP